MLRLMVVCGQARARICLSLLGLVLSGVLAGCANRPDPKLEESTGPAPVFSAHDVKGRLVEVGRATDGLDVLIFAGPDTSDAIQPVANRLATEFRNADRLRFIGVVDLRSLAFYERPFADGEMSDAYSRTIDRVNRHLGKQGLPVIDKLGDYFFMIADDGGAVAQGFQVPDPNQRPSCIVLDRAGRELGRFDPENELVDLIAAIRSQTNR